MSVDLSSILGGGLVLKRQLITANMTWSRPARMAGNTVFLTGIGGGASGRSTSGAPSAIFGGDGGQYAIKLPIDIGETTSVPVTIGMGGAASAVGAQPNHGTPTSFGAFLTLLGGVNRGTTGTPMPVGAPGGRGDNLSTMNGADTPLGYGGRLIANVTSSLGCGGGGLILDATMVGGGLSNNNVTPAQGYGAGGSGSAIATSGAGAPGALLVEWMEYA